MSTPFLNFSRIICTNFRKDHASGFWGAGLCGWNCRHTFFAVFPELGDPPAWTRDQLEELNARNIEYNGNQYTRYEINQMQRARERNVRRWKKRYLAETEAGVDTTDSAVRLKAARQSLAEFVKATGGHVDSARVSVPKFGRSEGSKAAWAAKITPNDFKISRGIGARAKTTLLLTNPPERNIILLGEPEHRMHRFLLKKAA